MQESQYFFPYLPRPAHNYTSETPGLTWRPYIAGGVKLRDWLHAGCFLPFHLRPNRELSLPSLFTYSLIYLLTHFIHVYISRIPEGQRNTSYLHKYIYSKKREEKKDTRKKFAINLKVFPLKSHGGQSFLSFTPASLLKRVKDPQLGRKNRKEKRGDGMAGRSEGDNKTSEKKIKANPRE